MPPPNVTAKLHIGHALNLVIQDYTCRLRQREGYEILWIPGVDHAGIATQNMVEKSLLKKGKLRNNFSREEFFQEIYNWSEKYKKIIKEQLLKMNLICNWEKFQYTMDPHFQEAVRYAFLSFYYNKNKEEKYFREDSLIYRGYYLVNWCPRCNTALSDDEIIKKQVKSDLYYIRYSEWKEGRNIFNKEKDSYIVVATSRPETILGDTALLANPEDNRYKFLKQMFFRIPLSEEKIELIWDKKFVNQDFGTGIVKITPAHDMADFEIAHRKIISFIQIINNQGKIDLSINNTLKDQYKTQMGSISRKTRDFQTRNELFKRYDQMDRYECRKEIVKDLKKYEYLEKIEKYQTTLNMCYRCETVIEPMFTKQWFLKMEGLAKKALDYSSFINIYPSYSKKVYINWLQKVKDWCISRQIIWGHRIPIWYCKECGKETAPDLENYMKDPDICKYCGSQDMTQDEDVLDTWFSSMLCPLIGFGWPNNLNLSEVFTERIIGNDQGYLTNFLATGHEIIYFWVARMVMASLYFLENLLPFKRVFIHPIIFDKQGRKMSKSLGNGIDPLEIIQEYSLDVLRFTLLYVLKSEKQISIKLDKKDFQIGYRLETKIKNVWKLIKNISNNEKKILPLEEENSKKLKIDNEMIFFSINRVIKGDIDSDKYMSIQEFYCWFFDSFCNYYIEFIKAYLNFRYSDSLREEIIKNVYQVWQKIVKKYIKYILPETYENIIKEDKYFKLGKIINDVEIEEDERKIHKEILPNVLGDLRMLRQELDLEQLFQKVRIFIEIDIVIKKDMWVEKYIIAKILNIKPIENIEIRFVELKFENNIESNNRIKERILLKGKQYKIGIIEEDKNRVEIYKIIEKLESLLEKKKREIEIVYKTLLNRINNKNLEENAFKEEFSNAASVYIKDSENFEKIRKEYMEIRYRENNVKKLKREKELKFIK